MNDDDILNRLERDMATHLRPVSTAPTRGAWIVDSLGRIIPANTNTPELDYIADVSVAPNGPQNIPVICAASLMFDALKAAKNDPGRKHLSAKTRELIDEALAAAE